MPQLHPTVMASPQARIMSTARIHVGPLQLGVRDPSSTRTSLRIASAPVRVALVRGRPGTHSPSPPAPLDVMGQDSAASR